MAVIFGGSFEAIKGLLQAYPQGAQEECVGVLEGLMYKLPIDLLECLRPQ